MTTFCLRWIALVSLCVSAQAAEVRVAVASNFAAPMQKIAQIFAQDTGHQAVLSIGSTGSLYAQIKHGAPFQLLLAADDETPEKIETEGLGIAGGRFTYAIGRLVLWSKQTGFVDAHGTVLKSARFDRLAMANPKLAPYGLAAFETLTHMGLWAQVRPKLVQGENIAQTYQFVVSENAQLGFVAMSQLVSSGNMSQGSAWVVPANWHTPLRQEAIMLVNGKDAPAASALMQYLRSEKAKAVIRAHGYELP